MKAGKGGWFATAFVKITEPLIFGRRPLTLLFVALVTAWLGFQASELSLSTGFEKQLPLSHPYIKVLRHYEKSFGTGNFVLVSLTAKHGDIYDGKFLNSLKVATDGVFYMPGVDRTKVKSLWTPNVRYVEAVNGGFVGGDIIPSSFSASAESITDVHRHVLLSDVIGRLVSNDQRSAMVVAELVERDPHTGKKLDYIQAGHHLESIRQRLTSPKEYDYVLKTASPPFKAGKLVERMYRDPRNWLDCLQRFSCFSDVRARLITDDGSAVYRRFSRDQLRLVEKVNPDYNPNVSVKIIGFTKVVSVVADYCMEVVAFFALTILLVWVLLSIYIGSPVIALYPLGCGLLAVLWELGLLHLFGFHLDPFAILVPFLVLSIGVSHGIQITNFWLLEVAERGRNSFDASRATYRRLVIPGVTALLTNVLGFATILIIPIGIVREMALNAMFGLFAVIICKKVLLPCVLSYARIRAPKKFREYQRKRDAQLQPLWHLASALTRKPMAITVLLVAALLSVGSLYMYRDLQVGVLHPGVPVLRPNGQYNKDSRYIASHYSIGVDVLQVYGKSRANGCIDPDAMHQIDRFSWYMRNSPGVVSTMSLPQADTVVWQKYNENNPRWGQLPGSRDGLILASQKFATSSGLFNDDCSVMPVYIYTTDHRAKTIDTVIASINHFKAMQGAHPQVEFQLAGGNVGVEAATNDVIKANDLSVLFWLFAAIAFCVWLSFRGVAGLVAVLVPLMAVSLYTYAIMVFLGIGETVATLPVVAFAAGIGVDYGIYIYSVLEENVLVKNMEIRAAYADTLHQTGKAVVVTALSLAASVATWMFSGLQFQIDMGILLTIMYVANAVAALVLLPAFSTFLMKRRSASGVVAEPEVLS